jgi:hypothetical protein
VPFQVQTQHSFSATDESPEAKSIGDPQDGQDAEIASLHSSRSQPASRSISFFSEGAGICDYGPGASALANATSPNLTLKLAG